jgi:hypothetical protein
MSSIIVAAPRKRPVSKRAPGPVIAQRIVEARSPQAIVRERGLALRTYKPAPRPEREWKALGLLAPERA